MNIKERFKYDDSCCGLEFRRLFERSSNEWDLFDVTLHQTSGQIFSFVC